MTQEPMTLGGRYQLKEVIGRGGMAEVWSATDTRLDRQVAIKRLRVDLANDPIFQARFQREAQSAAGLNHPNIVSVYDTGRQLDEKADVEVPYIVMELVQGHTLRDVLRDGRRIVPEKALEFAMGVLDALSFSHKQGIVHRDIKPANVMLTPTGQVKVMDFGIARAVADTSATMTQTAAVIGTAQYLSPEQARGETVDSRSDIYSAGCLLYELLTGRPPFIGDSPVSVAYQHVREMPVPPSQLDAEITPAMDAITMQALAKDPADRYQTAKAMRDDIARLLAGEQVTAVVPAVAPVKTVPQPEPTAVMPTKSLSTSEPVAEVVPVGSSVAAEAPRRMSAATIILLVLLALMLGTGGFFVWRSMNPPVVVDPMVDVPRVIGYTEEAAKSHLTNNNLVPNVVTTEGDADTKNQIVMQSPTEGERVREGSTVTITLNIGPKTGVIPAEIIGKPEAEAKRILRELGFTTPPTVKETPVGAEPLTAKAGDVTSVSPDVGQTVNLNDEIVLYLATGKSVMPNLKGISKDAAFDLAERSGFARANIVVKEEPSTQPVDQVIDQVPDEGTLWNRADRVTISVAVPMPTQTVTLSPPPVEPTVTPKPPPASDTPAPPPSTTAAPTPGG